MAFFEPLSEGVVRESLRRAKSQAHDRMKGDYDLAIDYMEERALQHVESELQIRYKGHQEQKAGERIHPIHVPIVEQYISEAASIYNHPLKRELVDFETEEVDTEATEAFSKMPGMQLLNPRMHRVDQISLLVKSCAMWPQVKRGALNPKVVVPQNVLPVADPTNDFADPADADDYLGYILQLDASEDINQIDPQRFVLLGNKQHLYYSGTSPYDIQGEVTKWQNPFVWEQVDAEVEGGVPTGRGTLVTAPLQMLTLWHDVEPLEGLIPDADASIAVLNLEIDVALSALLHDMRMHGGAQMFMTLMDPNRPPARLAFGSNFVIPLAPGESLGYAGSPIDYESLIRSLNALVQMYARSKRMDPRSFALETVGPESGFAKAVSALPKIDARNEHAAQVKTTEEGALWPRLGAIADFIGGDVSAGGWRLPKEARNYKMRVEFEALRFPMQASEEAARDEHNFKHGLDSPASKLAREQRITDEQAAELVAKNKGSQPATGDDGREKPGGGDIAAELASAATAAGDVVSESTPVVAPQESLNGAQVKALIDIAGAVTRGELDKEAATEIIITAFPIERERALKILAGEVKVTQQAAPEAPKPEPEEKPNGRAGFALARRNRRNRETSGPNQ